MVNQGVRDTGQTVNNADALYRHFSAMPRIIHVQLPPTWMEMLTTQLHRVRLERGCGLVGPKDAEHPPLEAFKGRLSMPALDRRR